MKKILCLLVVAWLTCGIFNTGSVYAYFQNKYPSIATESRKGDAAMALLIGVMGPIGTVGFGTICWINDDTPLKYGWKLPF